MPSTKQSPSIKYERNPGMVANLFPFNIANYNAKLLTSFLAQSWYSIWSILQTITICFSFFFLIKFCHLADQLMSDIWGTRFLAKIVAPEGSKEVAVGQPIAITVSVKMLCNFFSQHIV